MNLSAIDKSLRKHLQGTIIDRLHSRFFYAIKSRGYHLDQLEFDTPAGRIKIICDTSGFLGKFASRQGGHEPNLVKQLSDELDEESVYYDIGSHNGYMIAAAIKAGVEERNIHAFEADKLCCNILRKNFESVHITNSFVSNQVDDKSVTIDNYALENSPPDVIKIDVEGAEANVLFEMEDVLEKESPTIFAEIHPRFLSQFNRSEEEIFNYLEDLGYTIYAYDHQELKDPQRIKEYLSDEDEKSQTEYHIKAGP